jgi:hypothetical protein
MGSIAAEGTRKMYLRAVQSVPDFAEVGITSTRIGYLDKLNITGNVASSNEVVIIQNNTRVVRVVPATIEKPETGTSLYIAHLYLYDSAGNMEVPDYTPVITLTNQAGTNLASRLDSVNMTIVTPGHYKCVYTASSSDALEQLLWEFTIVENGIARTIGSNSLIVSQSSTIDFTTDDREKLGSVFDIVSSEDDTVYSDGIFFITPQTPLPSKK